MEREIEATTMARVPVARARSVLVRDLGHILGDGYRADRDGRPIVAELEVPFDTSRVRRRVEIEVRGIHLERDQGRWEITWRAFDRAALYPVFRGQLHVEEQTGSTTELRLHGTYTPPLGVLGAFGDGLVGHRLARRSVEAFVDRLAREVEAAVLAEQGQTS